MSFPKEPEEDGEHTPLTEAELQNQALKFMEAVELDHETRSAPERVPSGAAAQSWIEKKKGSAALQELRKKTKNPLHLAVVLGKDRTTQKHCRMAALVGEVFNRELHRGLKCMDTQEGSVAFAAERCIHWHMMCYTLASMVEKCDVLKQIGLSSDPCDNADEQPFNNADLLDVWQELEGEKTLCSQGSCQTVCERSALCLQSTLKTFVKI